MKPVIYAEDDQNDAYFMQLAFKSAGVANPLVSLINGRQVVDYLSGVGEYVDREKNPLPCLLLLDLKMPLLSGFDVLDWIRLEPSLKDLKVVVVSSSGQALDIELAKKLGALDYIIKPSRTAQLTDIVRGLKTKWLSGEPAP